MQIKIRLKELEQRSKAWYEFHTGNARLRRNFFNAMNKDLSVSSPVGYSAKVQWRKIYDRRPIYPILSDKLRFQRFVSEKLGEKEAVELFPPLLGVFENANNLSREDFRENVIIKPNNASGRMIIKRKGERINADDLDLLQKWLLINYGSINQEWAYQPIPRKLIVQSFLEKSGGGFPNDLKVAVFHGKARVLQMAARGLNESVESVAYFNTDWQLIPWYRPGYPLLGACPPPPPGLNNIISIAETLAGELDHLVVDFLYTEKRFWLNETTLYWHSGMTPFPDCERDEVLGSWWTLPKPICSDRRAIRDMARRYAWSR